MIDIGSGFNIVLFGASGLKPFLEQLAKHTENLNVRRAIVLI